MKSRGFALRGGRLGGTPGVEVDRGGAVEPRRVVSYWCFNGHESTPRFVASVEVPDVWPCDRCGLPASPEGSAPEPPPAPRGSSPKTPWEFLLMRRTVEEGEALLEEALEKLRADRAAHRR